ncbi:hypothetical protein ACFXG4_32775 [Nocardia sp. NPDC059246]|uniref:hypothetical protein n=1 Tax=unclassified Nocardia TaxID=2637762 RepID=UPI0036C23DE2
MNMHAFESAPDIDLDSDKPILALGWVWARYSDNLVADINRVRMYIAGNRWQVPPVSYIRPMSDVVQVGKWVRRPRAMDELMLACGYSEAQILVVPNRTHIPDLAVATGLINIASINDGEILWRRVRSELMRQQADANHTDSPEESPGPG